MSSAASKRQEEISAPPVLMTAQIIQHMTSGLSCCIFRMSRAIHVHLLAVKMQNSHASKLPHLQCLEDIKGQCMVPRPDAGVEESRVGVDIGSDAAPPHVCDESQSLSQLLPLAT